MKKLIVLMMGLVSTVTFAQGFSKPEIPVEGLSVHCRTTMDIQVADFDKDGRLFISAKIMDNDSLKDVVFKINQTSNFGEAYESKMTDLNITEMNFEGHHVRWIDSFEDAQFSFAITEFPMDFDSLANRVDTFSANVGVLTNPSQPGFAINYELRCVVTPN